MVCKGRRIKIAYKILYLTRTLKNNTQKAVVFKPVLRRRSDLYLTNKQVIKWIIPLFYKSLATSFIIGTDKKVAKKQKQK